MLLSSVKGRKVQGTDGETTRGREDTVTPPLEKPEESHPYHIKRRVRLLIRNHPEEKSLHLNQPLLRKRERRERERNGPTDRYVNKAD